jgi:hypothetical protein
MFQTFTANLTTPPPGNAFGSDYTWAHANWSIYKMATNHESGQSCSHRFLSACRYLIDCRLICILGSASARFCTDSSFQVLHLTNPTDGDRFQWRSIRTQYYAWPPGVSNSNIQNNAVWKKAKPIPKRSSTKCTQISANFEKRTPWCRDSQRSWRYWFTLLHHISRSRPNSQNIRDCKVLSGDARDKCSSNSIHSLLYMWVT